jgi:hypothetical protein
VFYLYLHLCSVNSEVKQNQDKLNGILEDARGPSHLCSDYFSFFRMVHGLKTPAALPIDRNPRINQWWEMRHEMGIKGGSRADEDFNVEDGLGSRFQRLRLPCAGFYANRSAGH